jgi:hypothetical protein
MHQFPFLPAFVLPFGVLKLMSFVDNQIDRVKKKIEG